MVVLGTNRYTTGLRGHILDQKGLLAAIHDHELRGYLSDVDCNHTIVGNSRHAMAEWMLMCTRYDPDVVVKGI